ncbi:MAG: UvrB/UvrC motif-containing protein [Verrucomicrobiales bacterium]|nr:UvrB/UvrC motif-containing protein [Verrucomicrobiales bacterium]
MKCDANCDWGEDASIFFSYIENSKVIKVNLCKYCANEKGVDDPTGYSLIDLMQGMGEETSSGKKDKKKGELTCQECGFTQSDFKKTGRFGCANCYEVFNEGLESLLEAMHKNTEHTGKVPSFVHDTSSVDSLSEIADFEKPAEFAFDELKLVDAGDELVEGDTGISALRDKLDIAISEEDYEEAARLRDEIAKLESEKAEEG